MPRDGVSSNEADAKRLRKAIGQFRSLITRSEKFAQEQNDQILIDLEGLHLRMEELQRGLQDYKSFCLDLLSLTDEEPTSDETEDRYFSVVSNMKKLIKQVKSDGQSQSKSQPPPAQQHSRLPQLDIGYFDGKHITEYKPFIDIFKAVVDQDTTLSLVQKLFYLKKY